MDIKKKEIKHCRNENAMEDLEEEYSIGPILGHGSFGVVNIVTLKNTKESFACKVLKKRIGATAAYQQQELEVNILKNLCHPNILHLYQVYETSKSIAMITELCDGGEMGQVMRDSDVFNDATIRSIITQLIDAVGKFLHSLVHFSISA